MKRFEHEVLTFSVDKPKDFTKMQETLREWGDVGFEIVSVLDHKNVGTNYTVFMKREMNQINEDEAA